MLMTMHSAKGLEFDTVFIVGAEDGVFPSSRVIGDIAEMEEERRLCYVAMTRAQRLLYFTSARRRMLFGKTNAANPSRFIEEISPDNLETHIAPYSFENDAFYDDSGWDAPTSQTNFNRYRFSDKSQLFDISREREEHAFERPSYTKPYTNRQATQTQPMQSNTKTKQALPRYKVGDTIKHTAFGKGTITELTPAGNDTLLVIEYESGETKRSLLNTASRYMEKVE
jgi:DNA helicase-2/ATP-dependent DNA helicase PcrA